MTLRRALLLLGIAGCDQAFGLERPEPTCAQLSSHDEDGDRIVDFCDNCPAIANERQEDEQEVEAGALADGVGDACDPLPRVAGDYIERFISFAEPDAMADLQRVSGSWQVEGERLLFDGLSSSDERYAYHVGDSILPGMTIVTHLTIEVIKDERSMLGLIPNADDQTGDGSGCLVYRPFETPTRLDTLKLFLPIGQADEFLGRQIENGDQHQLTYTIEARMLRCDTLGPLGVATSVTADLDADLRIGAVGFEGQAIKGSFDYVIVFARR